MNRHDIERRIIKTDRLVKNDATSRKDKSTLEMVKEKIEKKKNG